MISTLVFETFRQSFRQGTQGARGQLGVQGAHHAAKPWMGQVIDGVAVHVKQPGTSYGRSLWRKHFGTF